MRITPTPITRHLGASAHRLASAARAQRPAHAHRSYADIRRMLAAARLDPDAQALAGAIFARIAEVEAAFTDGRVDRVTFHEVGAYDSIADVIGFAAAIAYLAPASIGSLPPVVGTGGVGTAHGPVPVPAPATAALLSGIPMRPKAVGELTTPTGAAILAAVVDRFGPLPPMRVLAIGYGAGTRELADRRQRAAGDRWASRSARRCARGAGACCLLEANVDDMGGQLVAPLFEALFAAGALDVWSAPILMKKGRPAQQISALVDPERCGRGRARILLEFDHAGPAAPGRRTGHAAALVDAGRARHTARCGSSWPASRVRCSAPSPSSRIAVAWRARARRRSRTSGWRRRPPPTRCCARRGRAARPRPPAPRQLVAPDDRPTGKRGAAMTRWRARFDALGYAGARCWRSAHDESSCTPPRSTSLPSRRRGHRRHARPAWPIPNARG